MAEVVQYSDSRITASSGGHLNYNSLKQDNGPIRLYTDEHSLTFEHLVIEPYPTPDFQQYASVKREPEHDGV